MPNLRPSPAACALGRLALTGAPGGEGGFRSHAMPKGVYPRKPIHGHRVGNTESPTYSTWRSMLLRCTSPCNDSYRLYGARGITVCDRWRSFPQFLADMGERPEGMTLDRIDNDGNYEPGNCRWATRSEQQRHKRPYKQTKKRAPRCN